MQGAGDLDGPGRARAGGDGDAGFDRRRRVPAGGDAERQVFFDAR